ncbi:stilbene synthase [Horticoccus luteus]|uniref:Stilbene synthase n=1 Tax=Horticoccus luteus TaxID=2862869 RepID=A0A8F9TWH3_9BACT|nr:3-oxoacyl-[acyl-carrier-protein] synthase III C-terminal domain-containing protein [Horticoccus luteus]QYM79038.1 stilbene synthase [Horticoccus luteus]
MNLHALATAVPQLVLTQQQCWEIVDRSPEARQLSRRSQLTLRAILRGNSGIATRHFALPEIENVFARTADELNEGFRAEAPRLAAAALTRALDQAGVDVAALDALFICTCTGYLCPGVTSYVAEQLGLRPNAFLQDLVGLGCGAAIPTLRAADAFLHANPHATVATVAVEICSAAFYLDDDPGVLVSACLFGDGAAAAIWRTTPGPVPVRCHGFNTVHRPADRDRIRFEQRDGKLRNLLDAAVPQLAAAAVAALLAAERADPARPPITRILSHPGGRDVLDAIEAALPEFSLGTSREVLRRFGNMSSPSVLFALADALREGPPPDASDWWLVSFGAGFSAHSCRVSAA